jgi:hypothetical protein
MVLAPMCVCVRIGGESALDAAVQGRGGAATGFAALHSRRTTATAKDAYADYEEEDEEDCEQDEDKNEDVGFVLLGCCCSQLR